MSFPAESDDLDPRIRDSVIAVFEESGNSILEWLQMRPLFDRSRNLPHFQEVYQS